jgi:Coenzyme PQQ synthesis protein D (PqqD)
MHETIEGEVILIALDTGTYYSLRETGAEVWAGIQRGASGAEIADDLAQAYDGSREEIAAAVADLLGQLEAERLIEEGEAEGADETPRLAVAEARDGRAAFHAPVLEKHTDMQDLILLDPVHEVDARGWPHAAPSDASA